MYTKVQIQTEKKGSLLEITKEIQRIVSESGVKSGLAVVSTPHSDAGILCTSFYDPKGHEDIIDDFGRIWPARDNFRCHAPVSKCAAHSKAAVAGQVTDWIIEDGVIQLGNSQGIFFAEYCEPCQREYAVSILGV